MKPGGGRMARGPAGGWAGGPQPGPVWVKEPASRLLSLLAEGWKLGAVALGWKGRLGPVRLFAGVENRASSPSCSRMVRMNSGLTGQPL